MLVVRTGALFRSLAFYILLSAFLGVLLLVVGAQIAKAHAPGPYWTKVSTHSALKREGHKAVVYNNKMWILGGFYDQGGCVGWNCLSNDVWSSSDGVGWTRTTQNAPWSSRRILNRVEVFNNQLYVLGPKNPFFDRESNCSISTPCTATLEWWSSNNGVNWSRPATSPTFGQTVFTDASCSQFGDFTSSDGGLTYTLKIVVGAPGSACIYGLSNMVYETSIRYGNAGWKVGGHYPPNTPFRYQVEHTCKNADGSDGAYEQAMPWPDRPFWLNLNDQVTDERYYHASVVFNNRMWMLGGRYDNGGAISYAADGWASNTGSDAYGHENITYANSPCSGTQPTISKTAPTLIVYGGPGGAANIYKYTINYSFISGPGNGDDYHSILETLNHPDLKYYTGVSTNKPRLCNQLWPYQCQNIQDAQVSVQGQDILFQNLQNFNTVPSTLQKISLEFYITFTPNPANFSTACTSAITNDKVYLYGSGQIPADRSQYLAAIQSPPSSQIRCFQISKQFSQDGSSYSESITGLNPGDQIFARVNYQVYESSFSGDMAWGVLDRPFWFETATFNSLAAQITNVNIPGSTTALTPSQVDIRGSGLSQTILFKKIAVANANNYRLDFKLKVDPAICSPNVSNSALMVDPLNTNTQFTATAGANGYLANSQICGASISKITPNVIGNYALNFGTPSQFTINFSINSKNSNGQVSVREVLPDNFLRLFYNPTAGYPVEYCDITDPHNNVCTQLTTNRGQIFTQDRLVVFRYLPVVTNAQKSYQIKFYVTFTPPPSEFPYHCTAPLVNTQLQLYDYPLSGGTPTAELQGPYPKSEVRCLDLAKQSASNRRYNVNEFMLWQLRYKVYTSFAANSDGSSTNPAIGASPWAVYDLPQWYVFADPDFSSLQAGLWNPSTGQTTPLSESQVAIEGLVGKKTVIFKNIAVPNAQVNDRSVVFQLKPITCDRSFDRLSNLSRFINPTSQARLSGDSQANALYFPDCVGSGALDKRGPVEVVADASSHVYKYTLDYKVTAPTTGQNYSIRETLPNSDFALVTAPDPRSPKCIAKNGSPDCSGMEVSVAGQEVFFNRLPTVANKEIGAVVEFYLSFTGTAVSPCGTDVINRAILRNGTLEWVTNEATFTSKVKCQASQLTKTGPALLEYYGQPKTYLYTIRYSYTSSWGGDILIRDRLPNDAFKLASPAPTCTPNPNLPGSPNCQFVPGSFYQSGNDIIFRVPTVKDVPIGGTIQFNVSFTPTLADGTLDITKCANQAVNTAAILDGGNEAGSTTLTSDIECVDLRKYQSSNTNNPSSTSSDWVTRYTESAGITEGVKVLFRINYRASWSGSNGPISWGLRDTPQVGKLSFDASSVRLDAPVGKPYEGTVLTEGGDGDGSHFKINGAQIIFNHNNNLPAGNRQITFFMTVGSLACDTGGTANNEVVGAITARDPYGGASTTDLTTSKYLTQIELDCPFAVTGDVGVTGGTIPQELIVNGPSIVTLGSGSPTSSKIRDEVRVLPSFSTPYKSTKGWQEQIRRITNQLKTEFAKTRSLSFGGASGDPVLDFSTSPLRIFKYDLSTSAEKCLLENITLNGPGTLILTGSPLNDSTCKTQSIQIQGGILMRNITVTGGPVAIVVDNDCRNLETTNGTLIRFSLPAGSSEISFGSSNNPLALIAPCSVVDLGYPSRNISYHGLIVAGGVANANIQTGEITYEDEVINNPPPGLFQILKAVIKQVEP